MRVAVIILLATVGGSLAQTMSNLSCIAQPCTLGTSFVDIALVIDSSASIDRPYFDAIRSFINLWASDYSIGANPNQVQFGFVTYSLWANSAGTFSTASANIGTLNSVVSDLAYQGRNDRNLFDGLTKVKNNLLSNDSNSGWRQSSKHLMVVFSGDSFTGPDWRNVSSTVNSQFDRVVAVGLTQKAVTNQYLDLVTLVGGDASNVFLIGGASSLKYIIPWLEYHVCSVSSGSGTTPSGGTVTPPPTTTPLPFHTCQDYYASGQKTSGVYPININGPPVNVYCHMDDIGGWTVIQSRTDGSVDFNVSYDAYRNPLGRATNPYTDFWLGNDNIYQLSQMYHLQLRVTLTDCDKGPTYARYMNFSIDGPDQRYALHTDSITDDSDGGDAFNTDRFGYKDQGRPFATAATYTPQGGLTGGPAANQCKALLYGGWWFGTCVDNLNGKWYPVKPPLCVDNVYPDGIRWIRGGNFSLSQSLMEVLPTGVRLY